MARKRPENIFNYLPIIPRLIAMYANTKKLRRCAIEALNMSMSQAKLRMF
jgi:hypothetical protein